MNDPCSAMRQARALLYRRCGGLLAQQSAALAGFPEAAALPFCLDARGRPVFLLPAPGDCPPRGDRRVSLTLVEACAHAGRLILHGEIEPIDAWDEPSAGRFRRYFPVPEPRQPALDGGYWRLQPTHARHVDAAGRTRWLDAEDLLLLNPVHPDDERDFVRHMNACHTGAMRGYCMRADILVPGGVEPVMAGIDALGFHLRLGAHLVRFEFKRPVTALQEIRGELLALVREQRSPSIH